MNIQLKAYLAIQKEVRKVILMTESDLTPQIVNRYTVSELKEWLVLLKLDDLLERFEYFASVNNLL